MKLKALILKNFRTYQKPTRIEFGDLTALIGKNDIGKSTILEALDIFFGGGAIKLDSNDHSVNAPEDEKGIEIACVFTDIPEIIVLDSTSITSLKDEYLLNHDDNLEVWKAMTPSASGKPKETIRIHCNHPSNAKAIDLLSLNNQPA